MMCDLGRSTLDFVQKFVIVKYLAMARPKKIPVVQVGRVGRSEINFF
jgi:hypothetical protein